ncbi:uncharacterized protein LOC123711362 [Pieris brassicae]|uniref:uncharacterized protein LOC123711362 n=1 Tax=Pieris brassicae TaxID=7116 RepID=UPI001E662510|nr:uncharacterized protein LOC123711362 [Pieris brassicae]XP_045519871.1 uncharacterized protein LOC123711362 [Pieris brassicae]XP_045519872.1 uncharacterized protein LOC123711362 [Pieris brassicae]
MRQLKTSLWVVTVGSILITLIIYHLYKAPYSTSVLPHHTTSKFNKDLHQVADKQQPVPMNHMPLDELYKFENESDYSMEEDNTNPHMLWTPGCKIPLMMVSYKKRERKVKPDVCGKRLVFLTRIDSSNIRVLIKDDFLKKNTSYKNHECCLRFYMKGDDEIEDSDEYSSCNKCENGDTFMLQSDFVNVQCFGYDSQNESHVIYDDVYAFCKKKKPQKKRKCETRFNILMIGMDSMSLPRFAQTMTETLNFMKSNFWLSYRGYHKVDDNTFPNLMAILTGLKFQIFSDKCLGQMDPCNDLLLWTTFNSLGYVTAYGEDYVSLPDTFSKNYTLTIKPTDHYMKPLFKMAEKTKNCDGTPYLCSGKVTSGQQLLDYAYDFAMTYRDDPFFGLFWMNSFSHNPSNHPEDVDKIYENFLNRLFYTGVLKNTFVIFFSDHGVRFGKDRLNVEGYYDDRMPLLFILPPTLFKSRYPEKYKSMIVNQFRLVTPYDVYKTMFDIYKLSDCRPKTTTEYVTKKFNNHESLFNIVPGNRTCQDVLIEEKWCSCHKLYPLAEHDPNGLKVVHFVMDHIQNKTDTIVTKPCTSCMKTSLESVERIHFYYDDEKVNVYYVISIKMTPGEMVYEAKVLRRGLEMELVGSINIISGYKGLGSCTVSNNYKDRIFCVCHNDC